MSPERQLAALIAHPWKSYTAPDGHTDYGHECHMQYALRVNQLAALCDLHRRTPLTKEILELNGYESDGYGYYSAPDDVHMEVEKDGKIYAVVICYPEGFPETLCQLHSVADLENLLDLLGIDKQIKLPQTSAQHGQEQYV